MYTLKRHPLPFVFDKKKETISLKDACITSIDHPMFSVGSIYGFFRLHPDGLNLVKRQKMSVTIHAG